MSKPGKVLRNLCKKLGVRLTVKRGNKRIYKSVAVLKRQCANKKKKKVKRKRKFGAPIKPSEIRKRRAKMRKEKGLYYVPQGNFLYDEQGVKEAKKYFLERQRLREAQDFDALEKLIEKRRKLSIRKDAYLKKIKNRLKIKKGKVHGEAKQIGQFKYTIPGSKGKKYEVNLLTMECTCPNFTYHRSGFPIEHQDRCCKHIDEVFAQKRISQKDWLEHLGVAESVDPEVMELLEKFRINKFGRKKINRKRNKMKKEKISASLKKLCKKHKVRLTVKRGKKRVYKSVKILKAQCKKKKQVKKKKS